MQIFPIIKTVVAGAAGLAALSYENKVIKNAVTTYAKSDAGRKALEGVAGKLTENAGYISGTFTALTAAVVGKFGIYDHYEYVVEKLGFTHDHSGDAHN